VLFPTIFILGVVILLKLGQFLFAERSVVVLLVLASDDCQCKECAVRLPTALPVNETRARPEAGALRWLKAVIRVPSVL